MAAFGLDWLSLATGVGIIALLEFWRLRVTRQIGTSANDSDGRSGQSVYPPSKPEAPPSTTPASVWRRPAISLVTGWLSALALALVFSVKPERLALLTGFCVAVIWFVLSPRLPRAASPHQGFDLSDKG